MNTPKNKFLADLFRGMEEAGLEYCVSRNAEETFAKTGSDLDLLVAPAEEKRAEQLCVRIAAAHGYHLAIRTRFTNLCLLFWSAPAEFVRVDVEGNIRWRFFPVVSGRDLLAERRKEGMLYVPSAEGESLVLAAKVAWMGGLSERYQARMDLLWKELTESGAPDLAPANQRIIELARSGQAKELRWFLIRRALVAPAKWPAVLSNVQADVGRILSRVIKPPGYQVRYHGMDNIRWESLSRLLALALPIQKSYHHQGPGAPRKVFTSFFRSGLVFKENIAASPPPSAPSWLANRTIGTSCNRISVFRPGNGTIYQLHEDSGLMDEVPDQGTDPELAIASFIGKVMTRNIALASAAKPTRGVFVVLVGLDGAGKTTFARNLCSALVRDEPVRRARYYHWIPSFVRRAYPWPATGETPRKTQDTGALTGLLSSLRLLKSLLQASWTYHAGIRRWMNRGDHVVVDRFIYNYWLDPVSVRYRGPAWLLDFASRVMPKPDLVFSLETDADTLLSRKGELNRGEIAEQIEALKLIPQKGVRKVVLDAGKTPEEVLECALSALRSHAETASGS